MNTRRGMTLLGLVFPFLLGGCEVFEILFLEADRLAGEDYDIPVEQTGPEMQIDVDEQVTRMEDQVNERKNETDGRTNYEVLKALCETEPGKNCEPARFPARIPRYIWPYGCFVPDTTTPSIRVYKPTEECTDDMTCEETDIVALQGTIDPQNLPAGNGCVDVSDWISQVPGMADLTTVARATKMDLSERGSLEDSRQVKSVRIDNVTINFNSNSLSYPIPATETFVGSPVADADLNDAKLLIADGKVRKFGTLPVTAAGFTGPKRMSLDAAGSAELSDAIKAFKATVAAQTQLDVPPETEPAQADNCRNPQHLPTSTTDPCEGFPKPAGQVAFTVTIGATFTINPKGQ